jgi:hypothetical protein
MIGHLVTNRKMVVAKPIEFPRADPKALVTFDEATKVCTMNCGPCSGDPRTDKERRFLCDDCLIIEVPHVIGNKESREQ